MKDSPLCNLHVCTLTRFKMAPWKISTNRELWQATILARDFMENFCKYHYFVSKWTFLMICHNNNVNIKRIKVPPLCPFRNIFIPQNHEKYYNYYVEYLYDISISIHSKCIEMYQYFSNTLYNLRVQYKTVMCV